MLADHRAERLGRDGEDVRRLAVRAAFAVEVHHLGRVQGQELERVDRDEDRGDVRVDGVLLEADAQVVEDRVLREVVQVDEVVDLGVEALDVRDRALLGLVRRE